jgi:hypothetical protein
MSYGTIGADVIQTSGANLSPVFKDLNNSVVGTLPKSGQIVKAWGHFNGTLTNPITPTASYNVSSITKTGTGNYNINFITPMSSATYAVCSTVVHSDTFGTWGNLLVLTKTVNYVNLVTGYTGYGDYSQVQFAVFAN